MATNNALNTPLITLANTFTMSGNFTFTGTLTANTAVTFPTSGTLLSTASYPAPAAAAGKIIISDGVNWIASTPTFPNIATGTGTFLRADGTNWAASTLTIPDTLAINSLLYASSANVLAALSPAQNGVMVSGNTNVPAMLAGPGTTGNILQSNAAAAPSFSTATYPSVATGTGTILRADGTNWAASTATFADTYAINTILYNASANTVSGMAAANSAVMVSDETGVPRMLGSMTDGQLLVGKTGDEPVLTTLTAGTGISITEGTGTITINASASGLTWSNIGSTSQNAAVNNGYVSDDAGATTVTLPTTFAIGDVVLVEGLGAGGWILACQAGNTIQIGTSATSDGGSLTSAAATDNIEVVGVVANTTWRVQRTNSSGLTIA